MVLLRLSPLIPYNALDYLSGVTAIPLWAYSMAMFGMVPGIVMFCYIGATASSLTEGTSEGHGKTLKIVSLVFGITFAIGGFATATYYSKLELDRVSLFIYLFWKKGQDYWLSFRFWGCLNWQCIDQHISFYYCVVLLSLCRFFSDLGRRRTRQCLFGSYDNREQYTNEWQCCIFVSRQF